MSVQEQLKELLHDVLERKHKTMNTIYNDNSNQIVRQLKRLVKIWELLKKILKQLLQRL